MRVFLPYPPSANERLTQAKGRKGFVNTQRYRAWKHEAAWIVSLAARYGNVVKGPYRLNAVAMPPDRRGRDLDNLLKATCDALKDGGAIEDDSLCQRIQIAWGDLSESGILIEVESCLPLPSRAGGSAKSKGATVKSPRPRRSPRAATTQAVTIGEASATGPRGSLVLVSRPSSTSADSIGCPKMKPRT